MNEHRWPQVTGLIPLLTLLIALGCASQAKMETFQRDIEMKSKMAAWEQTTKIDTIAGYEKFLRQYPESQHANTAKMRLEELYGQRDWKIAQATDTVAIFEEFLRKYPKHPLAFQAKARLEILRRDLPAWEAAQKKNTKEAYQDFLKRHPTSHYAEKARGKIVDLEVTEIMSSKPGRLPPPEKISSVPGSSHSLIEIHNDTKFTLTVRYSGPKSFKIEIPPHEKKESKIHVGKYRVAASVDAAGVRNYAGEQVLEGGNYKSRYFIVSYGSHTFKPVKVMPKVIKAAPAEVMPLKVKPMELKPMELKPMEVKPMEVKPVPLEVEPVPAKRVKESN